jgi:lysophospholipase L1-like esterase
MASGLIVRSNSDASSGYEVGSYRWDGVDYISWGLPGIIVHSDQANGNAYPITAIDGQYYTWKLILKGAFARLYDANGKLILASQTAATLTNTYLGPAVAQPMGSWDFIEVKPLAKIFETFSVLGDSISNDVEEWPGIASASHNNGYCLVYNHAVPGAQVNYHIWSQAENAAAANPAYAIIALGTNDGSSIHINYEDGLNYLWGLIHKPIYAMGVLPKDPAGNRSDRNVEIENAVNDAQAAGVNVTYWNTDGWIDPATDTSDGLHPNTAGQIKIANEVLSRI